MLAMVTFRSLRVLAGRGSVPCRCSSGVLLAWLGHPPLYTVSQPRALGGQGATRVGPRPGPWARFGTPTYPWQVQFYGI